MQKFKITILFFLVLIFSSIGFAQSKSITDWPEVKMESKPWTYWWWLGSAVDKENITYNLEKFSEAGIGGVHIIPIYGVKGYEEKFIDYLSPAWIEMLAYTQSECERLGMGIDMTIGTGWPFGGPQVSSDFASSLINIVTLKAKGDSLINCNLIEEAKHNLDRKRDENNVMKILSVNAYSDNMSRIELTNHADSSGNFSWLTPAGEHEIIALIMEAPVQKVKRAAPGAEGNVVDPFSTEALNHYLSYFDKVFKNYNGKMLRSFYHDSYEYYNADWTKNFLEEFEKRRGYNLLDMLPYFLGEGNDEIVSRVKSDYRYTISELHVEFIKRAAEWSHNKGSMFRNQAHGSPTNLLDTYAAADIPECEIFGAPILDIPGLKREPEFVREEKVDPLILKFASSAAHVTGKNFVSSETGTWLAEHFQVSLKQIKPLVDLLLFSGVNHVFFHGIPYSPKEEEWPGWQFYAATNYGPTSSLWRDIPFLNSYIACCQSVLQSGKPDNELLIYFPVWDIWNSPKGKLLPFQVHQPEDWLLNTSFHNLAKKLSAKGYSFDYISDEQIINSKITEEQIVTGGNSYKTLIIPDCRFIPVKTYKKILQLAEEGAKIIFAGKLPKESPGYFQYENRTKEIQTIGERLSQIYESENNLFIDEEIFTTLPGINIKREEVADYGINFIRRKTDEGKYYFLVNQHSKPLNNWVKLAYPAEAVMILDPLTGKKGLSKIKHDAENGVSIFLHLEPGASLILKTLNAKINYNEWKYFKQEKPYFEIKGKWEITFLEGGPVIPESFTTDSLGSWANFGSENTKRFAGTARYSLKFQNPDENVKNWILDLGTVCESARVIINKKNADVLWSLPFRMNIGNILLPGENEIEIEVTNLSANRVRDLDIQGVNWKKFYDINFVNINYKKFDTSKWNLTESGLLGPVKLYAVSEYNTK